MQGGGCSLHIGCGRHLMCLQSLYGCGLFLMVCYAATLICCEADRRIIMPVMCICFVLDCIRILGGTCRLHSASSISAYGPIGRNLHQLICNHFAFFSLLLSSESRNNLTKIKIQENEFQTEVSRRVIGPTMSGR